MSELRTSKDFLQGYPFLVTEADVQARWGFQKPGSGTFFFCAWCGHKFKAGDIARCVYTNTAPEHKAIEGQMNNEEDCKCHYREYTKEEQSRIRQGDAYGGEGDSEISDSIIKRGKLVTCDNCRVRVETKGI